MLLIWVTEGIVSAGHLLLSCLWCFWKVLNHIYAFVCCWASTSFLSLTVVLETLTFSDTTCCQELVLYCLGIYFGSVLLSPLLSRKTGIAHSCGSIRSDLYVYGCTTPAPLLGIAGTTFKCFVEFPTRMIEKDSLLKEWLRKIYLSSIL